MGPWELDSTLEKDFPILPCLLLEGEQLSLSALSWYSPWCKWIFDGYEYHRSSAPLREVQCHGRKVRSFPLMGRCWACWSRERFERLWDMAGADGKKTSGTRGNGQSLLLLRKPSSCWRQGSNCKDVVGRAAYKLFFFFFNIPSSQVAFHYIKVRCPIFYDKACLPTF